MKTLRDNKNYSRQLLALALSLLLILLLPLVSLTLLSSLPEHYLEFPPQTLYIKHATFSLTATILYGLFLIAILSPFLLQLLKLRGTSHSSPQFYSFPSWGYAGVLLMLSSWVLAWSRLPIFSDIQQHTFTPLWLGYIISANALAKRKNGSCPITRSPGHYTLLFITSAAFWWLFEYLNRFTQNWYYLNVADFAAREYFLFATLAFSTVLPAVSVTKELIFGLNRRKSYQNFLRLSSLGTRSFNLLLLLAAALSLLFVSLSPDLLFPCLWLSPLIILCTLQSLLGRPSILEPIANGNWQQIVEWATASLICGVLWEVWNYYSLAKWVYQIPFVDTLRIAEMPLFGFAGYLPFGVLCGAITILIMPSSTDPASENNSFNKQENRSE